MASTYTTEPPPTATVLVHTTAGPLTISLFAQQTPLTCRNFLQLCVDGYYDNCTFHRISPGFVIQTGDPSGTGEGGQSIYDDDAENEYLDDKWARLLGKEKGDKIVFGDELHSRLKFNRRGLLGMAKTDGTGKAGSGSYGSQFFITLGDNRRELDGNCTLFGRVEGDGIYNVVKIGDAELFEGTERPLYPDKILRTEVVELPRGEAWETLKRRERIAQRQPVDSANSRDKKKDKTKKKKALGKQMLSFDDGGEDGSDTSVVPVRPKKAKFNPALVNDDSSNSNTNNHYNKKAKEDPSAAPAKRKLPSPLPVHRRTPSFPDPNTQLPLPNQQSPSRSPSPPSPPATAPKSKSAALEAEIAALKKSLRRTSPPRTDSANTRQKSALEAMIPETATRGRKRPRAGGNQTNAKADANAIKMLNAFRARLDKASSSGTTTSTTITTTPKPGPTNAAGRTEQKDSDKNNKTEDENQEEDETPLCDLHFIANCQSCASWDKKATTEENKKKKKKKQKKNDDSTKTHDGGDNNENNNEANEASNDDDGDNDDDDKSFLSHALKFTKDTLGKDLEWRKRDRNREYDDGLMVIDPREKEREIVAAAADRKGKGKSNSRRY